MNKTVFITGASSGFGKETTKLFQKKGWNVVATMRSPEKETELTKLDNVLVTQLDVTNQASIQAAIEAGLAKFGTIDVLVNNAGYGTMGAMEAASEEVIRKQFEVNLFGLINVIQAVLPTMRKSKNGIIVNLSSMGGKITFPFLSLYHATKFAVEGLTDSIQYELNPLGIKLKLVEPGGYKTEFAGRSMGFIGIADIVDYKDTFDKFILRNSKSAGGNTNIIEVAEAIYEAATDGTDKLRYPVGADAVQLIATKHQMDDVAYKNMIVKQMGL